MNHVDSVSRYSLSAYANIYGIFGAQGRPYYYDINALFAEAEGTFSLSLSLSVPLQLSLRASVKNTT